MLYASTRRVAIQLGEAEGIQIEKKVNNPFCPSLSELETVSNYRSDRRIIAG